MDKDIKKNRKPNIILIITDALRADKLGCYGSKEGLTPNMDKIAEEGIIFKDAYCGWTSTDPSLTSILTGKFPASHGIIKHGELIEDREIDLFNLTNTRMLQEILKERGYKTMAIDWMARWFKRGFDSYGFRIKRSLFGKTVNILFRQPVMYLKYLLKFPGFIKIYAGKARLSLKLIAKQFKDALKSFLFSKDLAEFQNAGLDVKIARKLIKTYGDGNYFLMIHCWDTHMPYNSRKKDLKYKGSDEEKQLLDRYDGSVRYVDDQIGVLFNWLKERDMLDDTMLIITSDHGESLTEHEIHFDHHGLYDQTIKVPLLVYSPGFLPGPKKINGFIQHIDLLPTILDIMGIEGGHLNMDGKSLMPLINGRAGETRPHIYVEESYTQRKKAIRTEKYKFISAMEGETGECRSCNKVHGGSKELYDLNADPGENNNIYDKDNTIAIDLEKKLNNIIEKLVRKREEVIRKEKKKPGKKEYETSGEVYSEKEKEEVKKRLQMLGYLD